MLFSTVVGYFRWYLTAETNWLKITPLLKIKKFRRFILTAKISTIFWWELILAVIVYNFQRLFSWMPPKGNNRRKLFGPIFGHFCLAAENSIDLFLTVFS
jgi:hypothetical protein